MKKITAFVVLVSSALLLWPTGAQSADVLIKFSHVVAPDAPKGKAALRFKELVEKRTNGRVVIEVHPNSQLYKDGEEMEALLAGSVQMIAPSLSKLSALGLNDFEVFDLPYLFPDWDFVHHITRGHIGQGLLRKLESKGVVGLGYWDNGFKVMSANHPIAHPDQLRGLKMRVQPSKVIEAQMRALGATPVAMPFSAVPQALRLGNVDGTENPPSNLYTQRMHEVQRHVVVSNHGYIGYVVLMEKKFWDLLSPEVQIQLRLAMLEATRFANDIAKKENDEALAKVKASGVTAVHELTPAEREAWRKALLPVHKKMEARVGKELLQEIYLEAISMGHKF